MEKITQFKARDGKTFETIESCFEHERLLVRLGEIMSKLVPTPKNDNCKFVNGGGYIQQNPQIVKKVRAEFLELTETLLGKKITSPILGRYLNDTSDNEAVYKAWCRLYCIDSQSREWGQPYYAHHDDEGTRTEYVPNQEDPNQ